MSPYVSIQRDMDTADDDLMVKAGRGRFAQDTVGELLRPVGLLGGQIRCQR
jgi:hypothetical protein